MQKNVVKFGVLALVLFLLTVFIRGFALFLLIIMIGYYAIYKIIRKNYGGFSVTKSVIVAFVFLFVLSVIWFFIWRWWALLYLFADFAQHPVPISKISFNEWKAIILWLINPTH